LCLIVAATNKDDLPNLRMTCKGLFEIADQQFVEAFFTHRTHVVSQQSMTALLNITKTPTLLRQIKSITINTLSGAIHSPYIKCGLFERTMREVFENIRRTGNLLDISVVADPSTHGYGYNALVTAEGSVTTFYTSLVFEHTMNALKKSGCPFRDLSVIRGCHVDHPDHQYLLAYIGNNDHFLSSGRSFACIDTWARNYCIKWQQRNGSNCMHIAPVSADGPYPIGPLRDAVDATETLAMVTHLRSTAVSHLTLENTSILDVQWLATSNLCMHLKSITTLNLIDVLVVQISGAASTFFQQIAKLPNLESCRMSGVQIVGSRNNKVYLIEVNTMSLEGPYVSDKLKQLGFTLEIDMDTWTQQESVQQSKNWKCTTEPMWRRISDIDEIQSYRLHVRSLQAAQGLPDAMYGLW